MSIPVALERLRAEAERFGATPYLLTVSDERSPAQRLGRGELGRRRARRHDG